jgi:DNA-binding response OmpR family regulator
VNIGLRARRKTILLIDEDAHARAALRNALEGAGFTVGEAANDREGERTALRVRPDAILAELMMAHDAGKTLSERLSAAGSAVPFYIVSTAADTLIGGVGLKELGISGVFLKPVDTAIVIQTLKTRLSIGDQSERKDGTHA